MSKFRIFITIILLLGVASVVYAQSNWYPNDTDTDGTDELQPNDDLWGVRVPALSGGGTQCLQVDNDGIFGVTGGACSTVSSTSTTYWQRTGSAIHPITITDNVGIATTTPDTALTVVGDISGTGQLIIDATSTLNGYVGIGKYPTRPLTIKSGGLNSRSIELTSAADSQELFVINEDPTGDAELYLYNSASAVKIGLFANGTSYFNGGDVGIGTASNIGSSILNVAGQYVHIGDGGTVGQATADGDLYVEDALEVDGTAYLTLLTVSATSTLATTSITKLEANDIYVTGNMGLGTTTPTYKLEVKATSTAGYFGVSQNSAGDLFAIDNSGNVGIGTDSPAEKLNVVAGNIKISGQAQYFGFADDIGMEFKNTGTLVLQGQAGVAITMDSNNNGTDTFKIYANGEGESGTVLMTVEEGGNTGINTTAPDRKLDILDATNPQLRLTHTDGSVYVDMQASSIGDLVITPSGDDIILNPSGTAFDIVLNTSDTSDNKSMILSGGGSSSRNRGSKIQLYGNEHATEPANIKMNLGNVATAYWDVSEGTSGSSNSLLYVAGTGNIGIGTTTPRSLLDIKNTSATTTITIGDDVVTPACLVLGDADGGGWTYCKAINGALTCSINPCDGN